MTERMKTVQMQLAGLNLVHTTDLVGKWDQSQSGNSVWYQAGAVGSNAVLAAAVLQVGWEEVGFQDWCMTGSRQDESGSQTGFQDTLVDGMLVVGSSQLV